VLTRLVLPILAALVVWLAGNAQAHAADRVIKPVGRDAAPAPTPVPVHKLGSRLLRQGMAGTDVRALQFFLGNLQLSTAAVDGIFGPATRRSVVAFERSRHMAVVDGRVQRHEAHRIKSAARRKMASGQFVFPVAGPHNFGGPGSAFGAPRAGHTHQGQDIMAACGTPLVAAQGGTVKANKYQASAAGYYLVIHGAVNGEDYVYAHMIAPSTALVGTPLAAGQQIGLVGKTGDATGCHLHFEMWTVPGWYSGGHPYDPLPSLLAWDAYS